jgi:hypothetical protein
MGFFYTFLLLLFFVIVVFVIFSKTKNLIIKNRKNKINKFLNSITLDNINSLSGTEFE